jgi:hypothetical protein
MAWASTLYAARFPALVEKRRLYAIGARIEVEAAAAAAVAAAEAGLARLAPTASRCGIILVLSSKRMVT